MADLLKGYESLNKKYPVPDIPSGMPGVKYIFLLESPHKNELKHGCPAAGCTGRNMSGRLPVPAGRPLGLLLKDGDPSCVSYGIMNVCQVPMQRSAYGKDALTSAEEAAVAELELLREAGNGSRKLYGAILSGLEARIKRLPKGTALLACGKFAADACGEIGIPPAFVLSHPYCWNFPFAQAGLDACPVLVRRSKQPRRPLAGAYL